MRTIILDCRFGPKTRVGKRPPRRWLKIWMPLAVFGLLIGVPETLCRVFRVVERTDARFRFLIQADEGDAAYPYNQEDPFLFWSVRPNFQGEVLTYDALTYASTGTLRTNSRGMRGKPFEIEKAPDTLRVLCLGDSCAFGLWVQDDETFCVQLEETLNAGETLKEAGYARCEVLNAGVTGYSSLQILQFYRLRGAELRPDVVVLYAAFNDACPSNGLSDREILDTVSRPLTGSFFERATLRLDMVRVARKWLFDRQRERFRGRPRPYRVAPHEYRANVLSLAEECEARGARFIVVRPPFWREDIERMEPEWSHRIGPRFPYLGTLDQVARDARLDLVSIDEMSEAGGRPLEEWFIDFCHPTPLGHRLIAQKLADRIASPHLSEPRQSAARSQR